MSLQDKEDDQFNQIKSYLLELYIPQGTGTNAHLHQPHAHKLSTHGRGQYTVHLEWFGHITWKFKL
jgi:hypothetical protein